MSSNRLSAEAAAAALDFEPVPLRYRRDGWTPARQAAFIAALRRTRCILAACREVGVSAAAAYKLYRHPAAASFRCAWHAAFAGPRRARPPSTSAGPSTSAPTRAPRAPFTAVALWPMPRPAAPAASCPSSISSTSPTSTETNSSCQTRQVRQLPRDHQPPDAAPPRERPAYSFEAFVRSAGRARIARRGAIPPPLDGEGRGGVDSATRSVSAETFTPTQPPPSRGRG